MVLEWHPNQADVSRVGDLYSDNAINYFRKILKKFAFWHLDGEHHVVLELSCNLIVKKFDNLNVLARLHLGAEKELKWSHLDASFEKLSSGFPCRSWETSCNGDMKDVLLFTVIFKCGGSKCGSFISDNPSGVFPKTCLWFSNLFMTSAASVDLVIQPCKFTECVNH
ncbi:hypothetical protein TNCV_1379941 [Trichonephila clavipes]|nr:hypothetical protein TNCV_1379941 [Trichonephila clavipes]